MCIQLPKIREEPTLKFLCLHSDLAVFVPKQYTILGILIQLSLGTYKNFVPRNPTDAKNYRHLSYKKKVVPFNQGVLKLFGTHNVSDILSRAGK